MCIRDSQYGDNCEVCASTYSPMDLINPRSAVSGATPIIKESEHFFFDLPAFEGMLKEWTRSGSLQPEIANKMQEWFEMCIRDRPCITPSLILLIRPIPRQVIVLQHHLRQVQVAAPQPVRFTIMPMY